MRLDQIHQLISQSRPDDWNDVKPGPVLPDAWSKTTGGDGWEVYQQAHHTLLVYRPDVRLSIAYGMPEEPDGLASTNQTPDWASNFTDNRGLRVKFADISWNGNLVDRYVVTPVDGGRAILPWPDVIIGERDGQKAPEIVGHKVTALHADLARLLDETAGHRSEFDHYMAQAGIQIIG